MRAILIDPEKRTITETDYDGDYKSIYPLIDADTYTVINIGGNNSIFIDDEGLLKNPRYFFKYEGYDQPLAGKGLILGSDDEGESIETDLIIEDIQTKISFLELSVKGFDTTQGKTTFHGREAFFMRTTPVFGPPDEEDESGNEVNNKDHE